MRELAVTGLDGLAEDITAAILRALPGPAHLSHAQVVREVAQEAVRQFAARETTAKTSIEAERRRLLALLLSDPPAPEPVVAALARTAGWRLPRRVAAVALADWARDVSRPPAGLPPDVLVDLTRPVPCLLMPDPDGPGRPRLLESGLRGWTSADSAIPAISPGPAPGLGTRAPAPGPGPRAQPPGCLAAIGPVVPLAGAHGSLHWAKRALALARRGVLAHSGGIVRCDEHISTLVLLADTELADLLTRRVLAPLRGLRPHQADRLAETLLAWLETAGNAGTVAGLLHVHPQTVRYRLRQLMELFGDALTDPDARFSLQVALRVRQLQDGSRRTSSPLR